MSLKLLSLDGGDMLALMSNCIIRDRQNYDLI